MHLIENITLAVSGLRANKMRALLTLLGIIIGIASVIGIVMVGDSLSNSMSSSLQEMGANNIQIQVQQKASEYGMDYNISLQESDMISDEMLRQFEDRFQEDIKAISVQESMGTGKIMDMRAFISYL